VDDEFAVDGDQCLLGENCGGITADYKLYRDRLSDTTRGSISNRLAHDEGFRKDLKRRAGNEALIGIYKNQLRFLNDLRPVLLLVAKGRLLAESFWQEKSISQRDALQILRMKKVDYSAWYATTMALAEELFRFHLTKPKPISTTFPSELL
jgi:hypothetical protein